MENEFEKQLVLTEGKEPKTDKAPVVTSASLTIINTEEGMSALKLEEGLEDNE